MNIFLLLTGASATCKFHCLKEAKQCESEGTCLLDEKIIECEKLTANNVEYWITEPWDFGGKNRGFISGDGLIYKGCIEPSNQTEPNMHVEVDIEKTHQEMLGFGAALTGSSAFIISKHPKKNEILNKLFNTIENNGFGISFLRLY